MDQRLQDPAGAAPPDWRGLCEELIEALETAGHRLRVIAPEAEQVLTWTGDAFAAAARASALLDQPEPEVVGPSLEEVEDLCEEHCFNVEGYESIECLQGLINDAIARYGHQPAPPAEDDCPACEGVPKPGNQPCAVCGRPALAAEADGPAVQSREPASVACEPSDGDLLQLMPEQFRADLGTVSRMAAHGAGPDIKPGLFRVSLNTGALEYARAVLARWGRPAPAPAEGEVEKAPAVTEVIAWLRTEAEIDDGFELTQSAAYQRRAAELLERQAAPVPVSKRLPGPDDCDAEGFCWWFSPADPSAGTFGVAACWVLRKPEPEDDFRTHWLPAHALPLPSGEVES